MYLGYFSNLKISGKRADVQVKDASNVAEGYRSGTYKNQVVSVQPTDKKGAVFDVYVVQKYSDYGLRGYYKQGKIYFINDYVGSGHKVMFTMKKSD